MGKAPCYTAAVQPLADWSTQQAADIEGLLFDLDDTVLDSGQLAVPTLQALYDLRAAGLRLVGVTGRPAAWGQVLLRQWPVDAMLTENGIIGLRRTGAGITQVDRLSPAERQARQRDVATLVADMQRAFPDLEPSDDVAGRVADFSFDIAEAKVLPEEVVLAATAYARSRGARVLRSSIHLHLSFDADDKATGALHLLALLYGVDPTVALARYVFIGDSGNDASCFAAFRHSVGVANLSGRPTLLPRYVTRGAMSAGFRELARKLIDSRT